MIIGLTHFGDSIFYPLLEAWLKQYKLSGCKYDVVILADEKAVLPPRCDPYDPAKSKPLTYIRFDTKAIPSIMRQNKAFDAKGSIICQALKILGECLILDTDAFFMKDPTQIINRLPKVKIAMGDDPNVRVIAGVGEYVAECNAGVLYFGTESADDHKQLVEAYETLFNKLKSANDNNMLEQITWTMICTELARKNESTKLPRELNWSYIWGRNTSSTFILHEHGPQKWARVAGAARDQDGRISMKYTEPYENFADVEGTLGVVLAHGSARDTVMRHIPYWLKVCSRLIVVTPVGDDLRLKHPLIDEYQRVPNGGAYSKSTNVRAYEALKLAYTKYPHKLVFLFEYDSLCWGPLKDKITPKGDEMAAILWPNEPVSPIPGKNFLGRFYLHFPHLYTRPGLNRVISSMERFVPFDAEWGYTDRYIGLAVERSGIKVIDWKAMGLAYSYENITGWPRRIVECTEAVKRGVLFTHGVKDEATLKTIAAGCPFGILEPYHENQCTLKPV